MTERAVGDADPADEVALLRRLAAGERSEPLAALYARYGKPLYGLGLRALGDGRLAEELVQDTFVRLWQSAGRFDAGRGTVRTFVYALARRAAVDLWRRESARATVPLDAAALAMLEQPQPDDDRYDALVTSLEVRDALDALPEKHREVLTLRFHDDLTQKQIADRLDVPLGTIKTRTYYGLRALRGELERRNLHA